MTIVSIVKSLIGVGILGFANVAKNFGGLLFIFLIVGFGLLVQVLNKLLVKSKNLSLHSNYSTIGYYIYNHRAIITIINVVIIMNNVGLSMAELL